MRPAPLAMLMLAALTSVASARPPAPKTPPPTIAPERGVVGQLCAAPGVVAAAVDARGLVRYLETEATPDGAKARRDTRVLKGAKATELLRGVLAADGLWCDGAKAREESEGCGDRLTDVTLGAAAGGKEQCVHRRGCMEWTEQESLCFLPVDGRWVVSMASRYPDGPLETEAFEEREAAAREKAMKLLKR